MSEILHSATVLSANHTCASCTSLRLRLWRALTAQELPLIYLPFDTLLWCVAFLRELCLYRFHVSPGIDGHGLLMPSFMTTRLYMIVSAASGHHQINHVWEFWMLGGIHIPFAPDILWNKPPGSMVVAGHSVGNMHESYSSILCLSRLSHCMFSWNWA